MPSDPRVGPPALPERGPAGAVATSAEVGREDVYPGTAPACPVDRRRWWALLVPMILLVAGCTGSARHPSASVATSASARRSAEPDWQRLFDLRDEPVAKAGAGIGDRVAFASTPYWGSGYLQRMVALVARPGPEGWSAAVRTSITGCEVTRGGFTADNVTRSTSLVDGGVALVARCDTGGTNGASVGAVLVVDDQGRGQLALGLYCGRTYLRPEGHHLLLTRGDLSGGGAYPQTGERHYSFTWNDDTAGEGIFQLDGPFQRLDAFHRDCQRSSGNVLDTSD